MNQNTIKEDHLEVAERILRYLQAHPEARDTLEGIAEWWLAENRISYAVEQVAKAVEWLVALGYVVKRQVTGGKTVYEFVKEWQDDDEK